jgi:hypothetical protein
MKRCPRRGRFPAALLVAFACAVPAVAEDAPPPVEEAVPKEEAAVPEEEDKGRGSDTEGWAPYVEFVEKTYVPPAEAGGLQEVHLKFHLDPEVPKGAKVFFSFLYLGATLDTLEYVLKDENRKNLALVWKPKQKLAEGDYFVMTRLPLYDPIAPEKKIAIQTGSVQRLIKERAKRFPPKFEPWQRLYMRDESDTIVVGDPGTSAEEAQALSKAYTDFMEELVSNMNEFVEEMEKVKAGEVLVKGGEVDEEKLTKVVEDWRKKQGRTQTSILEFQSKEPGLFQKSMTAHANLLELGRMVSKRSRQALKEVTDQYKLKKVINPGAKGFDLGYRWETLEKRLETIEGLVSVPAEGEAGEESAAGGETPSTDAVPSEPTPTETPEVVPEEPVPEKPATTKKKSAGNTKETKKPAPKSKTLEK